jgi:hypothetical protein
MGDTINELKKIDSYHLEAPYNTYLDQNDSNISRYIYLEL